MNSFKDILDRDFSGALIDSEYVDQTMKLLLPLGFTAENAIACVATCRDEICGPVAELIQKAWGEAFNFSSLGGMLTLGRTGFGAFHAHAPQTFARRQHIYYAMPHLGIDADGVIGAVLRSGIPEASKACGALFAFAGELAGGAVNEEINIKDIEQSVLKMRLLRTMNKGDTPSPIELTKLAERAIREDLEEAIAATVDTSEVDYAVFTGIQLHGPNRRDYVSPVMSYAVVEGTRHELSTGNGAS